MSETNEYLMEWVRKAEATIEEVREAVTAMKAVRRFVRGKLGLSE